MLANNVKPHIEIVPGRVAVIGASSSIGRRIVAAAGPDVIAITRGRANIPPCAELVIVSDYREIPPDTFANCIAIINCVGSTNGDLEELIRINVDVARNAAKVAAQVSVPKFVQISSFAVFGEAKFINAETLERPVDSYGASKLLADRAVLSSGVREVVILRLPAIVGEGIPSRLEALLTTWQKIHFMPVSRNAKRSMISVEAAAEAAIQLARAKVPFSGVVKVADPTPICLHELAFKYADFGRLRLWSVTLPDALALSLRKIFPNPFEKIFGTSILDEEDNLFDKLQIHGRLENEIDRIFSK